MIIWENSVSGGKNSKVKDPKAKYVQMVKKPTHTEPVWLEQGEE